MLYCDTELTWTKVAPSELVGAEFQRVQTAYISAPVVLIGEVVAPLEEVCAINAGWAKADPHNRPEIVMTKTRRKKIAVKPGPTTFELFKTHPWPV